MKSAAPRPRQPKGVPAGGEFDRVRGTDPEFDLAEPIDADAEAAAFEHVLERCGISSRKYARRFGVDPDEVQGAVIAGLMVRNQTCENWVVNSFRERGTLAQYIDVCSSRAAWRLANGHTSMQIADARAHLSRAIADANRSLSNDEIRALAADVASKHRSASLPEGWWLDSHPVSLDAMVIEPSVTDHADEGSDEMEDRKMALIRTLETRGPDSKAAVWAAVSEAFDVAPATPDLLSEEYCTKVRRGLAELGGMEAACRRWSNEELTADEEFILFAPWGSQRDIAKASLRDRWEPPSFAEQERIVDVLRMVGSQAAVAAWDSAVAGSMRKGKRSETRTRKSASGELKLVPR